MEWLWVLQSFVSNNTPTNCYALVSERLKQESTLGFIVFLAILLHKAPGAIGFGTFL